MVNGDEVKQLEELIRLMHDRMGELLAALEDYKKTCAHCHDRILELENIVFAPDIEGDEPDLVVVVDDDVLERAHRRTIARIKG